MKIVDGQIHVWLPNTPTQPWPDGLVSLQGPPFSIEKALAQLDESEVDRAILVPPSWVGCNNSYVMEAARRFPDRFAVMGRFDPDLPDGPSRLQAWRSQQGMLGIRMLLNSQAGLSLATEPRYSWFWEECARSRIPLMCFVPGNAGLLAPILERQPGIAIIVDHAARNPRGAKDEEAWSDLDDLLALARHPNLVVKVSSLPCFSSAPYPFPVLHDPIRRIYEAFGARRMIWGSDLTRLTVPYDENIRLFVEAMDIFSSDDLEWIMGRAAAHWCRWPF